MKFEDVEVGMKVKLVGNSYKEIFPPWERTLYKIGEVLDVSDIDESDGTILCENIETESIIWVYPEDIDYMDDEKEIKPEDKEKTMKFESVCGFRVDGEYFENGDNIIIRFKNGDIISGEINDYDDEVLYITSNNLGEIDIYINDCKDEISEVKRKAVIK